MWPWIRRLFRRRRPAEEEEDVFNRSPFQSEEWAYRWARTRKSAASAPEDGERWRLEEIRARDAFGLLVYDVWARPLGGPLDLQVIGIQLSFGASHPTHRGIKEGVLKQGDTVVLIYPDRPYPPDGSCETAQEVELRPLAPAASA